MANMKTTLTNSDILNGEVSSIGSQKAVQSARVIPVVVDLSRGNTLGFALLEALRADSDLADVFGGLNDRDRLLRVSAIVLRSPSSDVTLFAYPGAATHKDTLASGEDHYLPAVELWRVPMTGPAAVTLNVYVS